MATIAGGFLPGTASYSAQRADQGRDLMTNPGGAIIAPGSGYVVRNGYDPHGFGVSYPIVHFDSGPYAGQTLYVGHTLSALSQGARFDAGAVLSHTAATGSENWNGNATRAGWAEIGFAPGGAPGKWGQPTPFGVGNSAVVAPTSPARPGALGTTPLSVTPVVANTPPGKPPSAPGGDLAPLILALLNHPATAPPTLAPLPGSLAAPPPTTGAPAPASAFSPFPKL